MIPAPKILILYGLWDGCLHWRAVRPAEMLVSQGAYVALANKDERGVENYAHLYDAVVLPRMSWENRGDGERFINALHRAGICVIYECDDDLMSPEVNSRIHLIDPEASPEKLEERRLDRLAALRLCDGMTVSSPRLATVMRSLVDYPVHVVPNAIDLDWWREQLADEPRVIKGLTIGWSGGTRPDNDLIQMAIAWGRIAERFRDVTFIVYGWIPQFLKDYVPVDRIAVFDWRQVDQYAGPFVNIDIGCAAVTNEPFNRSKTAIKVFEYSAAGAACVATPALYGRVIKHGHSGYLVESADEWETALADLITNRPRRERLARNLAVKVAREHSLRVIAHRWPDAWGSIIAEFRERVSAQRSRIIIAR